MVKVILCLLILFGSAFVATSQIDTIDELESRNRSR